MLLLNKGVIKIISKLEDKDAKKIGGGYIIKTDNMHINHNKNLPFLIIDDSNGEILQRCATKKEAQKAAKDLGQNSKLVKPVG